MQKEITIVGAGLVGSLCALYMTKRGHKVSIFERRKDLRSEIITAGKSINLALSERGWTAFKKVGIDTEVKNIAIPMYKRIMHDEKSNLSDQAYGNKGQAIYSVSRAALNVLMMEMAEKNGAKLYFDERHERHAQTRETGWPFRDFCVDKKMNINRKNIKKKRQL